MAKARTRTRTETTSASSTEASAQQAVLLQGARLSDAAGGHAERDHHGQRRERRRPHALPHRSDRSLARSRTRESNLISKTKLLR
jgi:hypothetical protein